MRLELLDAPRPSGIRIASGAGMRGGGRDRRRATACRAPLTRMNTSRAAEAAGLHRLDHLLARRFLGFGRDRILEIEDRRRRPAACAPSRWRGRSSPACRARCGADGWSWVALHGRASRSECRNSCASVCQRCVRTTRMHLAGRRRRLSRRLDRGVRAASTATTLQRADRSALRRCARSAGAPAIVAVDMPIGLPERVGAGGRAAENAVRPLLGARQSSVFSVPSRGRDLRRPTTARPAGIAQATSDPPRKVSKQLFKIAPKIREVDERLARDAGRWPRGCSRCIPSWRSGGSTASSALTEPKKVKSRPYEPGLALRRGPAAPRRPAGRMPSNAAPPQGRGRRRPARRAGLRRRSRGAFMRDWRGRSPTRRRATRFGLPMAIWA